MANPHDGFAHNMFLEITEPTSTQIVPLTWSCQDNYYTNLGENFIPWGDMGGNLVVMVPYYSWTKFEATLGGGYDRPEYSKWGGDVEYNNGMVNGILIDYNNGNMIPFSGRFFSVPEPFTIMIMMIPIIFILMKSRKSRNRFVAVAR